MSDIADRAQDVIDQHLSASLAKRTQRINSSIPSAEYCEECDEKIPEARRRHLPGVQLCVECASWKERTQK